MIQMIGTDDGGGCGIIDWHIMYRLRNMKVRADGVKQHGNCER